VDEQAPELEGVRRLVGTVVREPRLSLDTDMIERGLLDSLALVELLVQIEQEYGIAIPFDDLEIDDLRTVKSIAGLVARWSRAAGGDPR
jgi:acyl carrier protein